MNDKTPNKRHDRDLYDFMLYKFRSGDQRFIMDIFENDAFLGRSIKKAYRSRSDESVSYEELLSELYLYLAEDNWRRLEGFRGACDLVIWLRTIASNFFKTYFRNNNRQIEIITLDDNAIIDADDNGSIYPPVETMRDIISAIISQWKSSNYRQVIDCRILRGLSAAETAEAMNVDRSKSDNYFSIARTKLIKEISTINPDRYETR